MLAKRQCNSIFKSTAGNYYNLSQWKLSFQEWTWNNKNLDKQIWREFVISSNPPKEIIKNVLQKIISDRRLEVEERTEATKIENKEESKE